MKIRKTCLEMMQLYLWLLQIVHTGDSFQKSVSLSWWFSGPAEETGAGASTGHQEHISRKKRHLRKPKRMSAILGSLSMTLNYSLFNHTPAVAGRTHLVFLHPNQKALTSLVSSKPKCFFSSFCFVSSSASIFFVLFFPKIFPYRLRCYCSGCER